ncbi:MAG: hypothetical protein ABIY50_07175 [Ignavibacteria bacterium]
MSDTIQNPDNSTPDKHITPENSTENISDTDKINDETITPIPPADPIQQTSVKQDPIQKSLSKNSNYQISLISKDLLKIFISTKQGVKINSSVKDKKSSVETQRNEIYLYPKFDNSTQEIEVMISIDEDEKSGPVIIESTETENHISENIIDKTEKSSNSNYQVNLINENLLKIKIITTCGIKIDSTSRDLKTSIDSQTNKIYLQPKEGEVQEIEITLTIDAELKKVVQKDEEGNNRLTPNPEVVDLIQPPSYPVYNDNEEFHDTDTGFKNPFDALRKLIQKNLLIGIIAAAALHSAAAGIIFMNINKKYKEPSPEEQSRIFIIQDLPDPKIKLEDVEDPNKPKIEETPVVNEPAKEEARDIQPRKTVRPPKVIRPRTKTEDENKDTTTGSSLTRELDSLRKLAEGITGDTSNAPDTSTSAFDIADSLRNNFSEKDIGLAMYFPKNWKIMDQREINKNDSAFSGVLLTDTTAEQPGTMTIFIFLDKDNKDFSSENFKTEFNMNDTTLRAYSMEPRTLAGSTSYRFYIFNNIGTEKLSVNAQVRKQYFNQYKNEIEAVVRSIRIKRKEDL